MAESLKIIHVCDHIVKEEFEELKLASINRQEIREPEIIDCKDKRLMYFGSWGFIEEASDNQYYKTSTPGNSLMMHFYGDNVRIYGRKAPDGGKVRIKVDGEVFGVMDLYSSSLVKKEPIIDARDLIYGMHTVQMELLTEKNELSEGTVLMIESAFIKDGIITELAPYDTISGGDVIKSITCVYQSIDGNIVHYKEGTDFIRLGVNKIKWIGIDRPNPKFKYNVEYLRRYSKSTPYRKSVCPRCYGLGWYGSFNNLTTGLPEKSQGIYKIAEDIIKIILTPLREDGYGSEFLEMNKNLYVDENSVSDLAVSEINRIERYYKSIQSEDMANGATYTPEDTLYAIIVNDVNFNAGASTLNIELTVYNNVGQSYDTSINI